MNRTRHLAATSSSPSRSRSGLRALALPIAGLALAAGCSSGGGGASGTPASGTFFDANANGEATQVRLAEMFWGRLVDVYTLDPADPDAAEELLYPDFVIGEDVRTEPGKWTVAVNPITGKTRFTILAADTPDPNDVFDQRLREAQTNLGPIQPKSLSPSALPPFPFVPRNGAIVMRFSDLLDHDSITAETVRVLVGNPPISPFDARIFPDPNHGAISSLDGQFHSTRIIVDTTISEFEVSSIPGTPAVNTVGLPPSVTTGAVNVGFRIPTRSDFAIGQFEVLQNVSGHELATANNGPVDATTSTVDVVRGMRSGGDPDLTGDLNNGFLVDLDAPRIVGSQPIVVTSVLDDPGGELGMDFLVTMDFVHPTCALTPDPGDVIEIGARFAEVTQQGNPPSGGTVSDLRVRVVGESSISATALLGQGRFQAPYTGSGGDLPACFVTISPTPGTPPTTNVQPLSQIVLRFTEPMDPASVTAFGSLFVVNDTLATTLGLDDVVVGEITASSDLTEFRYTPLLPFASATPPNYEIRVEDGANGITDLAGNALAVDLPNVNFSVDPNVAVAPNDGFSFRMDDLDMDDTSGDEIRGQFLIDIDRGLIKARPVERIAAAADRSQALVSVMIPFTPGVQTPLTPLGSRLMSLWRYADVGFTSTDENNYNVDVEHLHWSPVGGQVSTDAYEEFQIGLAHHSRLPDEALDSGLLPKYPASGFVPMEPFLANVLSDPLNKLTVVHDRSKGYVVEPVNLFKNANGTPLIPWPLNQDVPISEFQYFTWRDTAVLSVGGGSPGSPNAGAGMDTESMVNVGLATSIGAVAPQGEVPSIGLPLLMDFRCYPTPDGLGLNAFDVSLAINSSDRPFFRAFSSGGIGPGGTPIEKNPDLQTSPTGGFSPVTQGQFNMGDPTPGRDNVFYIGQADLVYRVSRVHTRWVDTSFSAPDFLLPVTEPRPDQHPIGTSVNLAFRGATSIPAPVPMSGQAPLTDASTLDAYGDVPAFDPTVLYHDPALKNENFGFLTPNDFTWKSDINSIDGAQFVQLRISFVGNTATNLAPELSAVGIAFQ